MEYLINGETTRTKYYNALIINNTHLINHENLANDENISIFVCLEKTFNFYLILIKLIFLESA